VIESNERLEQRVRERTADLNTARSRLNAILDGISEAVLYIAKLNSNDARPSVTYVNPAFCRLFGVSEAEIIGKTIPELSMQLFQRADRVIDNMEACHKTPETKIVETDLVAYRSNGEFLFVHVTITLVSTDEHHGFVVLIRDISQEKRLEAERERFIANASHELRTPLASATARLYLIRRQPEKIAEHLRVIESGINRMTALVEDLLDVSRFQRGIITLRREPVNLQSLIAAAVDEQRATAAEKGISLQVDLPVTPLTAIVDPTRIIQMLSNLILNGIIYTPKGGHVSVRLRPTGHLDNLQAKISVQDTGIGIAEGELEEIFKPFYRVEMGKAYGTGLGLTISREIVKLHGGEITVESTPNVGTTFTVLLPLKLPTPYKE
jgi:two-component system sensor histidine kinase VicK